MQRTLTTLALSFCFLLIGNYLFAQDLKVLLMNVLRKILMFISLTLSVSAGYSQGCDNIDFSRGDFTGWVGQTGNCCPINLTETGIVYNRHTIMGNLTEYDYNTGNHLKVIPPGYSYSARLGNANTGAQAEALSYTLTVDNNNALFIYKFAVVLEDPGHDPEEQPRFQISVQDKDGNVLDQCTEYSVVSAPTIPNFQSYGSVRWRDWTTVGLNLLPYLGKTVTIELKTGDCDLTGHYGYAYFVGQCSPMELAASYCAGADTATLIAPDGFSKYEWTNGETTQKVNLTSWTEGEIFSCKLTSVTGCEAVLSSRLEKAEVDFDFEDKCTNYISFINKGTNMPSITYVWDFGDGTTSTERSPRHYYEKGVYTVNLTMNTPTVSCSKTISKTVNVDPDIMIKDTAICVGQKANVAAYVSPNATIGWYSDQTYSKLITNDASFETSILTKDTVFYIKAVSLKCTTFDSVFVKVYPKPEFSTKDTLVCIGDATITLNRPYITELLWYSDGNLTNLLYSGNSLNIHLVSDTVLYYKATNPSCTVVDTLNIKIIQESILRVKDTFACYGSKIVLKSETNANLNWYYYSNYSGFLTSAPTYETPELRYNSYYYMEIDHPVCKTRGVIKINILTINAGNLSSSQTICYNDAPTQITGSASSGGEGEFHYQWQKSDNNYTWLNIPLANDINYTPDPISQTSYFRRGAKCDICDTVYTYSHTVYVLSKPKITTLPDQEVCYDTKPSYVEAHVDAGYWNYQWEMSTDTISWEDIPNATRSWFYPPNLLTTTYYRMRLMNSLCSTEYSPTVTVKVKDSISVSVSANQTICYNSMPSELSLTGSQIDGTLFQWQKSINLRSWEDIVDAERERYLPPALTQVTYYRVQVTVNACKVYSSPITVDIQSPLTVSVTATAARICAGSSPSLTLTSPVDQFVYQIFSDTELTNKVYEFTGDGHPKTIALSDTTLLSDASYYIMVSDTNACVSTIPLKVSVPVTVLHMQPESLPMYFNDVAYSQQITSNAHKPVYIVSKGALPSGITLTPDGLLAGVVPLSDGSLKYTITISVSDSMGCTIEKAYLLRTCAPAPIIPTQKLSYCVGDVAEVLQATVLSGMALRWFDVNLDPLTDGVPRPKTDIPGSTAYYVAQYNDTIDCEGMKTKIDVTVNDLPSVTAMADSICTNTAPIVVFKNTTAGTVYKVFRSGIEMYSGASIADGDLVATLSETISDDTSYQVQSLNANNCASSMVDLSVSVIKLALTTNSLPMYFTDTPYSTQLASNANDPTFSYTGTLPTGMNLSTTGLLSGTISDTGTYTISITVTDAKGCSVSKQYELKICAPAPIIPVQKLSYCVGDVADVLQATSLSGMELRWYTGNQTTYATSATPLTTVAGVQSFYVSQHNPTLDCEGLKTKIDVTVNDLPSVTAMADPICTNTAPIIVFKNTTAGTVYKVSRSGIELYSQASAIDGDLVATLSETISDDNKYNIQAINFNDCISPASEVTVSVIKLALTTNSLPMYFTDTPYSTQLASNANEPIFSYTGTLPTGMNLSTTGILSGTISGTDTYTITITATDAKGCSVSKQYELRTCEPEPIIPTQKLSYCVGDVADILQATALSGMELRWYIGNQTTHVASATPLTTTAGVQSFYVSQYNSTLDCEGLKMKIEVTVNDLPTVTAMVDPICSNTAPIIVFKNTTAGTVYKASRSGLEMYSGTSLVDGDLLATLSESISDDTKYNIQAINLNGCISPTSEVTVSVTKIDFTNTDLPLYFSNTPYSFQLESNANNPVYSLVSGTLPEGITINNLGLISGTVPSSAEIGTYTFTASVTDDKGCEAQKEFILRTCEPTPSVTTDTVLYCQNTTAQPLTATGSFPLQWYNTNKVKLSSAPTPDTKTVGVQVYYVAQVNDVLNCVGQEAMIVVRILPLPINNIEALAPDVCSGESPVIDIVNPSNFIYHVYSDAAGTVAVQQNNTTDVFTFPYALNQSESFFIRADNGACQSKDLVKFDVRVINLEITPASLPIYQKNVDYLAELKTNAEHPHFSITDGELPDGLTLSSMGIISGKVPSSAGNTDKVFTVKVENDIHCTVSIVYTLQGIIFVPQAFTPNGDGSNDEFMKGYRVTIFDRLGVIIYQGEDGWDGTYNGSMAPADTYFYQLEYKDENGNDAKRVGYIGLVKPR